MVPLRFYENTMIMRGLIIIRPRSGLYWLIIISLSIMSVNSLAMCHLSYERIFKTTNGLPTRTKNIYSHVMRLFVHGLTQGTFLSSIHRCLLLTSAHYMSLESCTEHLNLHRASPWRWQITRWIQFAKNCSPSRHPCKSSHLNLRLLICYLNYNRASQEQNGTTRQACGWTRW